MSNDIVEYKADNGTEIKVSEQDVRDLLAASNSSAAQNVTPSEIKAFLRLCQAQRLNPFTRDAYLVKYGNSPATIIAGKETFTKRAQKNPLFQGYTAGITVLGIDGKLHRREGSMVLAGEQLVGGWCSVLIKGYSSPMFDEVSLAEYSTGKGNWVKMPATMIRKVAICHALREDFPDDLGGLYGAEEMSQAEPVEETAPAPIAEPVQEELEVVSEAPETAPEAPDNKKTLWASVADVKAQAEALGITSEGLCSWASVNFLNEDGTPKAMNLYTEEEIARFRDYIVAIIADHQSLQQPAQETMPEEIYEPPLSDNDIAF